MGRRGYSRCLTGEATCFQVPQIQLPDATIAQRINQQLLGYVTNYNSAVDVTASPRRQLAQVVGNAATMRTRKPVRGTGLSCEVLLNQNYLLPWSFARATGAWNSPIHLYL